MRYPLIILVIIFIASNSFTQDIIYRKDKTIHEGKVLEVDLEDVKYKRADIIDGPIYRISKKDILKIRYANGTEEIFNTSLYGGTNFYKSTSKNSDTVDYSLIYMIYNHGGHTDKLPLYFNDKFIIKLKNQNRVVYKVFSEGPLIIKRFDGEKTGPKIDLWITHGKFYGVKIEIPYPHGLDPNKRFRMTIYADSAEFHDFLKDDFYSFKPFPKEDFYFEEDPNKPIIQGN